MAHTSERYRNSRIHNACYHAYLSPTVLFPNYICNSEIKELCCVTETFKSCWHIIGTYWGTLDFEVPTKPK